MPSVSTSCSAGGSTGGSTSSGGMGTPSSGATAPAAGVPADLVPPTDPKCTTTTSFPGYCQPKATTCTASTDCPAAWTCNEIPSSSVDSGPATRPAADGGAGVAAPMTNDLPAPPPPQNQKVCISPLGYGGTGYRDQSTSNDGKGGGSSTANPEAPPSTGSPATTGGPGESGGLSPKAGCAVGGGAGSSLALVAFGVVGIALARRRRK
jgi:MYXO-CTERM domain-containing protein